MQVHKLDLDGFDLDSTLMGNIGDDFFLGDDFLDCELGVAPRFRRRLPVRGTLRREVEVLENELQFNILVACFHGG